MADKKLMDDKDVEFFDIQKQFSNNMDKSIDRIVDKFGNDTNTIVTLLFLFFWTKFHHMYGVKGEKHDTNDIKKSINKIIDGDIPPRELLN